MSIILPSLLTYKNQLLAKGASYPLKSVGFTESGLLQELPEVSAEKKGWPWVIETSPSLYNKKIDWPKITIVTPSYNQGGFIEETIRSVLLQNYPNLEYIIIDGGSTDGTRNVLEKYSRWLSYWQSEKDTGQSNAINKGFSIAGGDYEAWINSDDYYLPDVFFKVIKTFIKTGAGFVYGYSYNLKTEGQVFELVKMAPVIDYFLRFPSLAQPSCFWSKKIHQPLWEELHCSLDYELWQRMLKNVKKKQLKLPLSVANVHDAAKTHNPQMGNIWAKDHALICDDDAHGVVKNWLVINFLNRVWVKLFRLIA